MFLAIYISGVISCILMCAYLLAEANADGENITLDDVLYSLMVSLASWIGFLFAMSVKGDKVLIKGKKPLKTDVKD